MEEKIDFLHIPIIQSFSGKVGAKTQSTKIPLPNNVNDYAAWEIITSGTYPNSFIIFRDGEELGSNIFKSAGALKGNFSFKLTHPRSDISFILVAYPASLDPPKIRPAARSDHWWDKFEFFLPSPSSLAIEVKKDNEWKKLPSSEFSLIDFIEETPVRCVARFVTNGEVATSSKIVKTKAIDLWQQKGIDWLREEFMFTREKYDLRYISSPKNSTFHCDIHFGLAKYKYGQKEYAKFPMNRTFLGRAVMMANGSEVGELQRRWLTIPTNPFLSSFQNKWPFEFFPEDEAHRMGDPDSLMIFPNGKYQLFRAKYSWKDIGFVEIVGDSSPTHVDAKLHSWKRVTRQGENRWTVIHRARKPFPASGVAQQNQAQPPFCIPELCRFIVKLVDPVESHHLRQVCKQWYNYLVNSTPISSLALRQKSLTVWGEFGRIEYSNIKVESFKAPRHHIHRNQTPEKLIFNWSEEK